MAVIGGVNLGNLTDYLMFIADGRDDANWQGASKGYVGDVAVDGIQADERTSGFVPYAGTIFTNDVTLDAWQQIVDDNAGQASGSTGNVALIAGLETDLVNAFQQINALPVTPGFESVSSTSLNGLNTQNGISELFVINVTSGFSISSKINITGDPGDVYVLRWDTDANPANGYQGDVKFQSGGAIVPNGGLLPSNFIHVAGDISSSGGGSNPPPPYPQGPRFTNGQGALIVGGQDFNGGGFFTGYWLTTGDPSIAGPGGLLIGPTGSFSNAIFVGGWYTLTTAYSLTSGSSGVYVEPNPATLQTPAIHVLKEVSVDGGLTFQDANTPPFPVLVPPTNPVYRFTVTNTGTVTLDNVTLTDSVLGPIVLGTTTLAPGASTTAIVSGLFAAGEQCNTATATGDGAGQTVVATDPACYVGQATEPCISVVKLVSVNGGLTFEDANLPPGPTLVSPQTPIFRYVVTNCGPVPINNITLVDSHLGPIPFPAVLLPGQSFSVDVPDVFTFGQHCNTATVTGTDPAGAPVSDADTACYTGVSGAALEVLKLVSVDNGATFIDAHSPPFPVLIAPTNPIYQWVVTNIGTVTLTNVTLVDTDFGPIVLPGNTLAPGESFTVTITGTFAPGDQCNTAIASATGDQGAIVATDFACYIGQSPSIQVLKEVSVDGGLTFQDANTPPGPTLTFPTNPVYRFTVTNTGTATLTNVTVSDPDFGGIVIGPITLAPGASSSVTLTGTFALGTHCNTATASGTADGQTVTDQDSACYTGEPEQAPAIDVLKEVSVDGGLTFQDANNPPGPPLVAPTNPVYRFTVTNVGNQTLTGVTVSDTDFGIVIGPITLAPGASASTTQTGAFVLGTHCDTATAIGVAENGVTVTDQDSACFTGVQQPLTPSIDIEKLVSVDGGLTFQDADTAPGPTLLFPTNPIFRIIVRNTGALTITNITVVDTVFGTIPIPTNTLAPGASFTVTFAGTWAPGQHCNCARVTGLAINGQTVTDTDRAFWFGRKSAVPVFPDISGPAPQDQIIDRLLETVALEELALAALINAEAEKVQATVAAGVMGPVDPEDLVAINNAVAEVLRMASQKESHLRRKLNRILAHKERPTPPDCDTCPPLGPTPPQIL